MFVKPNRYTLFITAFAILIWSNIGAPPTFNSRSPSAKEKVVVVTGGASGLGLQIVKKYSQEGFQVVIAARKPPTDQEVLSSPNITYIATDLEQSAELKNLVDAVMNKFGTLDLIVHNAAMASLESSTVVDSEILTRTVQTNYIAPAELTAYALHKMEDVKKPLRIIYVSSAAAIMPQGNFARYGASKAAAELHFLTLSQELQTLKSTKQLLANHEVAIVRPAFIRGSYTPHATGDSSDLKTAESLRNLSPTTSEDVVDKIFSVSQKKVMPILQNVGPDGALMELGHRILPVTLLNKIQSAAISLVNSPLINSNQSCKDQLSQFLLSPKTITITAAGAALVTYIISGHEEASDK
jgi:NAD(P)-dependent dehydrogenase (short-subunit alcohol dehydrogenase family)